MYDDCFCPRLCTQNGRDVFALLGVVFGRVLYIDPYDNNVLIYNRDSFHEGGIREKLDVFDINNVTFILK